MTLHETFSDMLWLNELLAENIDLDAKQLAVIALERLEKIEDINYLHAILLMISPRENYSLIMEELMIWLELLKLVPSKELLFASLRILIRRLDNSQEHCKALLEQTNETDSFQVAKSTLANCKTVYKFILLEEKFRDAIQEILEENSLHLSDVLITKTSMVEDRQLVLHRGTRHYSVQAKVSITFNMFPEAKENFVSVTSISRLKKLFTLAEKLYRFAKTKPALSE